MSQADQEKQDSDFEINQAALDCHANSRPGKPVMKGKGVLFKHFADIGLPKAP